MTRAIVGARVSRFSDEGKTSHLTQRESGERYATAQDWTVVGTFEDLDVSASISPWDRPDLGPWFDRADEWDALIFAKVDRAFRSIKDCSDVAYWAEQNKKILVFADDGIVCNFRDGNGTDMSSMIAKLFLVMTSIFAEMELNRFKGRNKDARVFLDGTDRWPGGKVPFGFNAVKHPIQGKTLVIDEESAEVIRTMGRMFLSGRSTTDIADYLTAEGFETPTQRIYRNSEKKPRRVPSSQWNKVSVSQMLKSPHVMGWKVLGKAKTQTLARGEDGMPIRMAPSIFTEEDWTAIQGEIKRRGNTPERRMNASPLLGVIFCGSCGHRLYRNMNVSKGTEYVYYRCPVMPGKPACPKHGWREEFLNTAVSEGVERDLSEIPVVRKVFVPGESHTAELEVVLTAMSDYMDQLDSGTFGFPGGQEMFAERMKRLSERKQELELLPQRADSWELVPTGETYSEAYARMDEKERRLLLLASGVKFYFAPQTIRIQVPNDLRELVQAHVM